MSSNFSGLFQGIILKPETNLYFFEMESVLKPGIFNSKWYLFFRQEYKKIFDDRLV